MEEQENKMSETKKCKHGVIATSCFVCHPELSKAADCIFSPETDAAYAAYKTINKGE